VAENHNMIECFCDECYENFWSYIGKDICPVCEKLLSDKRYEETNKFEKIKKTTRSIEQ